MKPDFAAIAGAMLKDWFDGSQISTKVVTDDQDRLLYFTIKELEAAYESGRKAREWPSEAEVANAACANIIGVTGADRDCVLCFMAGVDWVRCKLEAK